MLNLLHMDSLVISQLAFQQEQNSVALHIAKLKQIVTYTMLNHHQIIYLSYVQHTI
jgi:hypothetical protein